MTRQVHEGRQVAQECIEDCGRGPGAKDAAVDHWRRELSFTVDRTRAIRCLKGYGAWTAEELAADSDDTLAERCLWLACSNFAEFQVSPDAGSDIFVLE